jgi:dienelactone hydrolase
LRGLFGVAPMLYGCGPSAAAELWELAPLGGAAHAQGLPAPSGSLPVGTSYLVFVDRSRRDPFSSDSTALREITARIWYPAKAVGSAAPEPYLPYDEGILRMFNLPASLAETETHSFRDLPLAAASERYPVLVFNHGWGENFAHSTALMEELASHGYIVLSIAHHGEVKFSVYPDGSYLVLDQGSERFGKIMQEQRNPEAFAMFERMFGAKTKEEQEAVFKESSRLLPTLLVDGPKLWAKDISFVIGEIDKLNRADGPFRGRLDTDKIGVFGMSMGGIATSVACASDARCRAGINIDGGLYGDLIDSVHPIPFMFMNSVRYTGYDEFFLDHCGAQGYCVTIAGSDHMNFTDLPFLMTSVPLTGTIEQTKMQLIVNAYVRAFFDEHLRGKESDLLHGRSTSYPEVTFRAKE